MDNRIYPAADRYYLILCVYKYFGCFYLGQYRSDCRPGTCKIHSAFLKARIFCTVVCLLLAYPLAMILNSFHFKHQSFVVFLFVLPMWMNFMLRILAWRLLLSNNGIVNALFGLFGFGPVKMLNTPTAVVFG